jgi:hypothetical protein
MNELLNYLLQNLSIVPKENPKPRQNRRGKSLLAQHGQKYKRINRELARAVKTYGRTQKPHDLKRVERLRKALLSVNGETGE